MALILQCGTAAAVTFIVVSIPPFGFECSSAGYVAYGMIGLIIMLLSITSTVSARISEVSMGSAAAKGFTAFVAIALRRISFLLALANGTGLIVLSCLQFSNFFDSCYCNARVAGRGVDSYIIILYVGSITTIRYFRLAAVLISGVSIFIYMVFLRLVTLLPHGLNDN